MQDRKIYCKQGKNTELSQGHPHHLVVILICFAPTSLYETTAQLEPTFYPLKGSEVGAELHLTSPLVSYGEATVQLGRIKFTLKFFQDHYLNSLRPNFGV